MVNKLIDIAFSGFWQFIGVEIMIGITFQFFFNFLFRVINRLIRHMNIRKKGWPPSHLDADGDINLDI